MGNVATMYVDHLPLPLAVLRVGEIPNTVKIHLRACPPNKPVEELVKLIGGGVGVDKNPFVFYAVEGALVLL